jgi:hypothetical protein
MRASDELTPVTWIPPPDVFASTSLMAFDDSGLFRYNRPFWEFCASASKPETINKKLKMILMI